MLVLSIFLIFSVECVFGVRDLLDVLERGKKYSFDSFDIDARHGQDWYAVTDKYGEKKILRFEFKIVEEDSVKICNFSKLGYNLRRSLKNEDFGNIVIGKYINEFFDIYQKCGGDQLPCDFFEDKTADLIARKFFSFVMNTNVCGNDELQRLIETIPVDLNNYSHRFHALEGSSFSLANSFFLDKSSTYSTTETSTYKSTTQPKTTTLPKTSPKTTTLPYVTNSPYEPEMTELVQYPEFVEDPPRSCPSENLKIPTVFEDEQTCSVKYSFVCILKRLEKLQVKNNKCFDEFYFVAERVLLEITRLSIVGDGDHHCIYRTHEAPCNLLNFREPKRISDFATSLSDIIRFVDSKCGKDSLKNTIMRDISTLNSISKNCF